MNRLEELGFVYFAGGKVRIGTTNPLPCNFEGYRHNETPVREIEVAPFWIAKAKVTNAEYCALKPKHRRALEGPGDRCPVTDVNYAEALGFCKKASALYGLEFRLPTEEEWMFAASPEGLDFPWGNEPDITKAHTFGDGTDEWIVEIDDPRWPPTKEGLHQINHNVSELTMGTRIAVTGGALDAENDGVYCIVKGGNYGHCKNSPGIQRRSLTDIVSRNPRIGFRLAHNA